MLSVIVGAEASVSRALGTCLLNTAGSEEATTAVRLPSERLWTTSRRVGASVLLSMRLALPDAPCRSSVRASGICSRHSDYVLAVHGRRANTSLCDLRVEARRHGRRRLGALDDGRRGLGEHCACVAAGYQGVAHVVVELALQIGENGCI